MVLGQGLEPWVVPGVTVTGNQHCKPSGPSPGGGFVLAARAAPAGLPPVDGPRQLSQGMAGRAGQEQALGKKSGSVLGGRLLPQPLAAAGDTHTCQFRKVSPALGLRKHHRVQLHPSNRNSHFPAEQT